MNKLDIEGQRILSWMYTNKYINISLLIILAAYFVISPKIPKIGELLYSNIIFRILIILLIIFLASHDPKLAIMITAIYLLGLNKINNIENFSSEKKSIIEKDIIKSIEKDEQKLLSVISTIQNDTPMNKFLKTTKFFSTNENELFNKLNQTSDINLLILLLSLGSIFNKKDLINLIKKLYNNFRSKKLVKKRSKRFESFIFMTVIFAEHTNPQNDPEFTKLLESYMSNNYYMDLINILKQKTIETFKNIDYDEFRILIEFMIYSLNENELLILINQIYSGDKLNNEFKLMLKKWNDK